MPNLAKFPGIHNSCILLKLRYFTSFQYVRCNIMLASNNFIFFQAHLTPARLQELPIYQQITPEFIHRILTLFIKSPRIHTKFQRQMMWWTLSYLLHMRLLLMPRKNLRKLTKMTTTKIRNKSLAQTSSSLRQSLLFNNPNRTCQIHTTEMGIR